MLYAQVDLSSLSGCSDDLGSQPRLIAERLSARHVIAEYCVEIVCLYNVPRKPGICAKSGLPCAN